MNYYQHWIDLIGTNILDSGGSRAHSLPKQKRREPVSIAIGIICKDAIVLASDSKVTASSGPTSARLDSDKIHKVEFKSNKALVATAGSIIASGRVLEIVRSKCADAEITDYRQLADAVESASGAWRSMLLASYSPLTLQPSDVDSICLGHEYEILTASYFNQQPSIFKIGFPPGFALKAKSYIAIGCGSGVAEFLLSWFDLGKMNVPEATVTACFVIEEVKKADAHCGGPAQVGILYNAYDIATIYNPVTIQTIERQLSNASIEYKTGWKKIAEKAISEISREVEDRIKKK